MFHNNRLQEQVYLPTVRQDILVAHRCLYDRTEKGISQAFAATSQALVNLQLQIKVKLVAMKGSQEQEISEHQSQNPMHDTDMSEFLNSVKAIDRALEAFTTHADNLIHIKLTLARVAALVSPTSQLTQIVTTLPQEPKQLMHSFLASSMPQSPPSSSFHSTLAIPQYSISPSSSYMGDRVTSVFSIPSHHPVDPPFFNTSHSSNSRGPRAPECSCFVFYLPPSMTNETLSNLFSRCGTVLNAYAAIDKRTNRPRGFGFVDFSTKEEAAAAVETFNGYAIEGKFLHVSLKI